jgi:hypothetical protein
VLQSILTVVVVGMVAAAGSQGSQQLAGSMGVVQAASMLMQGLESSVFTTATAVAYHQLRVAGEGPAAQQLVQVFE